MGKRCTRSDTMVETFWFLKINFWTFKNVGGALFQYVQYCWSSHPRIPNTSRHKWILNHTNCLVVFRVLNPARVWVINPTARWQTWLRSISSSTKTGGSKLGFSPDDGFVALHPQPKGTSPSATGALLRVGTGHYRVLHAFQR